MVTLKTIQGHLNNGYQTACGCVNTVSGKLFEVTEKTKHSTTALEHAAIIAKDTLALYFGNNMPKPAIHISGDLGMLVKMIDGLQLYFPIEHFIKGNFLKSSISENIFYTAHLIVSTFDMHVLLRDAKIVNLKQCVVDLGQKFPVLQPLSRISVSQFIPYTIIVMFTAHATNAIEKYFLATKIANSQLEQNAEKRAKEIKNASVTDGSLATIWQNLDKLKSEHTELTSQLAQATPDQVDGLNEAKKQVETSIADLQNRISLKKQQALYQLAYAVGTVATTALSLIPVVAKADPRISLALNTVVHVIGFSGSIHGAYNP